jgi:hypothetical protein
VDGPGTRSGDWIVTDLGLRLPVAPLFDPGPYRGNEYRPRGGFCLDEQGQVTHVS